MKILLDKDKCIGCGTCWGLCDKYFTQDQQGKSRLKGGNGGEMEVEQIDCAKDAVEACPVQCIKTS